MTGLKVAQGGHYANEGRRLSSSLWQLGLAAYHVLYCAEKPGPDTKASCCTALLLFDCQDFVSHAVAARQ